MSSRVSSATVSRSWPSSGWGYGKKPCPVFLPSRPCATRRSRISGGSNDSPHSEPARSSASTTSSRPRSSARANGPGRMAAPIIIPISMSLAEATPSSRTRQDSTSALSPKRSTSVSVAVPLAAVLMEPLPGLLAQVARLDEVLHLRHHVEAIAVGVAQMLGHVQDCIEAEQISQVVRAHRGRLRLLDQLVDLPYLQVLLLGHPPDLRDGR